MQCFFIRRIWVLSEYKRWKVIILSAIAFIILGAAMFIGFKDVGHQLFSGFHGVLGSSIPYSRHLSHRCRLYPHRYHVECSRHGIRWRDCRPSLLLSLKGTPSSSSRSRHWFMTQSISPGPVSRIQTTSSTHSLSILSTLVPSRARHRPHILCSSLHRPTQPCTLLSTSCSQSYTQTLSMHL